MSDHSLQESSSGQFYSVIRTITKHYPFLRGTRRVSRVVGSIIRPSPGWMVTPDSPFLPRLALDMRTEFQRRLYLFPKAYGRLYIRGELVVLLRKELSTGAAFLDIGANVGVYSMIAATLVGSTGHVFSFEPEPTAFEALRRTAEANQYDNLSLINVAVSNTNSQAILYRDGPGSTASSLVGYKPETRHENRSQVSVRVARVDDLRTSIGLDRVRIQLVKIDVEGAEVSALEGMLRTLELASHPPIWCEVRGIQGSRRAPGTFKAVAALLKTLGYSPFRFRKGREEPVTEVTVREDILFRSAPIEHSCGPFRNA